MQLVVVMEYLPGGELLSLLKAKSRFTEGEARRIFGQIVAAVAYCHRENIIHRDLKLENIFVKKTDKSALVCKIGDFGLARFLEVQANSNCGTQNYMAPEIL
jgi:serine/threonine protein kinase